MLFMYEAAVGYAASLYEIRFLAFVLPWVVNYDDEAEIFHGEIVNKRDVITFQSENSKDIKREMTDSIDAHIAFCEKSGREPSKPFPGEFIVRTTPEKHGFFTAAAKLSGLSLNKWTNSVLENAARDVLHQ